MTREEFKDLTGFEPKTGMVLSVKVGTQKGFGLLLLDTERGDIIGGCGGERNSWWSFLENITPHDIVFIYGLPEQNILCGSINQTGEKIYEKKKKTSVRIISDIDPYGGRIGMDDNFKIGDYVRFIDWSEIIYCNGTIVKIPTRMTKGYFLVQKESDGTVHLSHTRDFILIKRKETKRIFNEIDPYGEEDWNE